VDPASVSVRITRLKNHNSTHINSSPAGIISQPARS
jgi:hypothetical protein